MEKSLKLHCLLVLLLSSCSLLDVYEHTEQIRFESRKVDKASIYSLHSKELQEVKRPLNMPVVAVYPTSFTDQTGQRKSNSEFALFSTAVTQAPSNLLIRALKWAVSTSFQLLKK